MPLQQAFCQGEPFVVSHISNFDTPIRPSVSQGIQHGAEELVVYRSTVEVGKW